MGGGYSQVYSVQNYDYLRHACVPGHLICLRKKEDINNASQSPIGIIPKSTRLIQQSILFSVCQPEMRTYNRLIFLQFKFKTRTNQNLLTTHFDLVLGTTHPVSPPDLNEIIKKNALMV